MGIYLNNLSVLYRYYYCVVLVHGEVYSLISDNTIKMIVECNFSYQIIFHNIHFWHKRILFGYYWSLRKVRISGEILLG